MASRQSDMQQLLQVVVAAMFDIHVQPHAASAASQMGCDWHISSSWAAAVGGADRSKDHCKHHCQDVLAKTVTSKALRNLMEGCQRTQPRLQRH